MWTVAEGDMTVCGAGMRESREREITISDWSHVAFLAMLEFLYTGSLSDISNEASALCLCPVVLSPCHIVALCCFTQHRVSLS